MTDKQFPVLVRSGLGTLDSEGKFSDMLATIYRVPRNHSGWQSVRYQGKRYQLFGGIRTDWFISLRLNA